MICPLCAHHSDEFYELLRHVAHHAQCPVAYCQQPAGEDCIGPTGRPWSIPHRERLKVTEEVGQANEMLRSKGYEPRDLL